MVWFHVQHWWNGWGIGKWTFVRSSWKKRGEWKDHLACIGIQNNTVNPCMCCGSFIWEQSLVAAAVPNICGWVTIALSEVGHLRNLSLKSKNNIIERVLLIIRYHTFILYCELGNFNPDLPIHLGLLSTQGVYTLYIGRLLVGFGVGIMSFVVSFLPHESWTLNIQFCSTSYLCKKFLLVGSHLHCWDCSYATTGYSWHCKSGCSS